LKCLASDQNKSGVVLVSLS